MRSSTSSSDPEVERAGARGWVVTLLATFFGAVALLYAGLILFDPYDTGRLASLGLAGVSDNNLRTADASRGRDKAFDAAIFGSSTGQSLDPRLLSARTGLRFVQLSITQAGPREILALLDYFGSRHARVGGVVVSADVEWCSDDLALGIRYPFPFWLYGSDWEYLAHVLNWITFDRVAWRAQMLLGRRAASDPVGFHPYVNEGKPEGFEALPVQPDLGPPGAGFPWIERLRGSIERLGAGAAVVIVMPPVAREFLPGAGSAAAARIAGCKAALAGLVAGRPRSGLIDDHVESAIGRDRADFFDRIHYKPAVARGIEAQIVAVLNGTGSGRSVALQGAVADNRP